MTRTKSQEHITPVLQSSHWHPVTKWIEYKILCLIYQCVHKTATEYLQELVSQYNPPSSLRSSSLCRLSISGFDEDTNEKRSGARSFRNAASTLWNKLPGKLHQAKDIASFRRQLTSFFFFFNFVISSSSAPLSLPHVLLPLLSHSPPPFPSLLPSATSMGFSCMESDCALQVDIDGDISVPLKHSQGHCEWYEQVNLNKEYHHV